MILRIDGVYHTVFRIGESTRNGTKVPVYVAPYLDNPMAPTKTITLPCSWLAAEKRDGIRSYEGQWVEYTSLKHAYS